LTVAALSGVATFSNLSIDKVGSGYQLHATSSGVTATDSSTFAISPAAATHFSLVASASPITAGDSVDVAVTARDQFQNVDTNFTGLVPRSSDYPFATLLRSLTVSAVSGVATFSNPSIEKVGSGYQLHATSSGVPATDSSRFAVSPAAATHFSLVAS